MKNAASNGTVFVTFTDQKLAPFAVNWARQLHAIGLRSLVGTAEMLGEPAERALAAAGARIFCADRVGLMAANGQAGRWAEAQLVLKLAARLSLSVLLSDADIAWIRNPLSYFDAVRASHPSLDLLMMTDRAFNGYSSEALRIQPATIAPSHSGLHGLMPRRSSKARSLLAGGAAPSSSDSSSSSRGSASAAAASTRSFHNGIDLELEPAYESSISYNIGVIWFCAHALGPLDEMLGRWVVAVGGASSSSSSSRSGGGGGGRMKPQTHGRRLQWANGQSSSSSSSSSNGGWFGRRLLWGNNQPKLAVWDQEPINKQVLQRGLRRDPNDKRLARVDSKERGARTRFVCVCVHCVERTAMRQLLTAALARACARVCAAAALPHQVIASQWAYSQCCNSPLRSHIICFESGAACLMSPRHIASMQSLRTVMRRSVR